MGSSTAVERLDFAARSQEETVRFHAYLPTYWDHYGSDSMESAILTAAKAAAELRYEGVWANDRLLDTSIEHGIEVGQLIEPLITLASLVHVAPALSLGTAVVVLPRRDPVLVAKQAAALHTLSGGRLILGVGIGHQPAEFAALGRSFSRRAEAAEEAIEVMQTLWNEPNASYHGQFSDFENVAQRPQPPGGGPPIWVGGNSRGAIGRAARHGSGWLAFVNDGDRYIRDLDGFRSQVARLHELTVGRPRPTVANMIYLRLERADEPKAMRSTTPGMPAAFTGTADAIAQHLSGYRDAGLDDALLVFESESVSDLLRQMEAFAERVAPRFVGAG
jgi:probable F420-dependent oxidoreductase